MVGALQYVDRYYPVARYAPVDPIQKATPVSGISRRFHSAESAALSAIRPETVQNAWIYSSNRVRVNANVNEASFDNAPLTKNAAHIRARARTAMGSKSFLSSFRQAAAGGRTLPAKAAESKKEVKTEENVEKNADKIALSSSDGGGFSMIKMADLLDSLGNYIDIYA